eukprot:1153936-Pelagomonas_calceolata.AAC.5
MKNKQKKREGRSVHAIQTPSAQTGSPSKMLRPGQVAWRIEGGKRAAREQEFNPRRLTKHLCPCRQHSAHKHARKAWLVRRAGGSWTGAQLVSQLDRATAGITSGRKGSHKVTCS